MIPDAQIIITEHADFMGGVERIEWEWRGGTVVKLDKRAVYQAGISKARPGDVVNVGPFRLRVIDYDIMMRSHILVRTGFMGTAKYITYRLTKHFDFIYRRLVLTATVWGLAKYDEYSVPTWRDVYFLDWLFKSSK